MPESTYHDRTETVEQKLALLQSAWAKRDYRLARAIADSVRYTIAVEQDQRESLGPVASPASHAVPVASLPSPWREWARGWSHVKPIVLDETVGLARSSEPVEIAVAFPAASVASLAREVRVARIDGGALREIACQVQEECVRGAERHCRLIFQADSAAHARSRYLILYGNPDAELPAPASDLTVTGEGYGLDIENDFFKAQLSRQMGQLERLTYKREHGLELFAGGDGHGEPPGIDWAHDYVGAGNFQKFRITNWAECPDYEVLRGPLCVTIRRWGFPHSTVHPLFTPARMNIFVEYRFYAGLPWFVKTGSMQVIQDMEIGYLRDDEWVFSGMSFTDPLWMSSDGKLREGAVDAARTKDLWGVGFYNRQTRDSFIGLFLEHTAENIPRLDHTGAPLFYYKWHGHVWSRALFHNAKLPTGAVLRQRNAYLTLPFAEKDGAQRVEQIRHRMLNPLALSRLDTVDGAGASSAGGRLARPGEAGDSPVPKRLLWEALRDCLDEQLYTAKASVVDLGLVRDLRVHGSTVHVLMSMPHRGRPLLGYFAHGSGGNSQPVRQRLMRVPGVRKVVVEQTWEPRWGVNSLTAEGRRKMGLSGADA